MSDLKPVLRRELAELEHDLFGFQEKGWTLTDGEGADITAPFVQRLARRIRAAEEALGVRKD